MPAAKRSRSGSPTPASRTPSQSDGGEYLNSAPASPSPSLSPSAPPTPPAKSKAKAKVKVKPKPSSPKTTPKKARKTAATSPSPNVGVDARTILASAVVARGIAAVMADSKVIVAETGLTAKQIQNHLGKGRSMRRLLEEAAKSI